MAQNPLTLNPATARGCYRPVRLELLSRITDQGEVLDGAGEVYGRCRTRREAKCPSCAREYARDARTIIRSGIPEKRRAGQHIAFLTLTAPGREIFGTAHHRLRGRTTGPCPCGKHHERGDALLGAPIDPSAFRYDLAAEWNEKLPELWRRFLINLDRDLNMPQEKRYDISFVKVVEVQRRGLWHIHAILRFDPHPSGQLLQQQIAEAIRRAAGSATASGHKLGTQLDVKFARQRPPRRRKGESKSDYADRVRRSDTVAGFANYLAKYATKGPEHAIARGGASAELIQHHAKLKKAGRARARGVLRYRERVAAQKAAAEREQGIIKDTWRSEVVRVSRARATEEAFGFAGHFLTKSRAYGKTFGDLRAETRAAAVSAFGGIGTMDLLREWRVSGHGYATREHHQYVVELWDTTLRELGARAPAFWSG
jgi:hypothetical protein